LSINVPVLAVVGRKHSGKTTVVEGLVSELVKKGLRVATVKHVSRRGFSMDAEGKDTWRHSTAGANPVMLVSDVEMTVKIRDGASMTLGTLTKIAKENGAEVVIVEGHSFIVLKDKRVAKIVCVRSKQEYDEYKENAVGEVLAYCSIQPINDQVLGTKTGLSVMLEKAESFIEKSRKIIEIQKQLSGLDCRKCGKTSCWELAEAISRGEAELEDCVPLKAKRGLKVTIIVNDAEVPVQPFVAEIVRKTVLAMISTLKGVNITGKEQIQMKIT
jgi:molybdopterin-guanine dinucleotide biosynthesis protein B